MTSGLLSRVVRGRGAALRLAASAVLLVSVMPLTLTASAHSANAGKWVLGVSNTLVGNGWREEMICAVKAEAVASGVVSKVVVHDVNGVAADQINGIRDLISSGANAIIINPSDPKALNPVIFQAHKQGIVVVTVDQRVTSPYAYQAENDQVAYGRVGMEWLAKKLGGKGNIVLLRGIAGVPADSDRQQGVEEVLAKYPGIKVLSQVYTGWVNAPAAQKMSTLLSEYGSKINGVWTSGTDYAVVNAFATAKVPYVPIVGADNNEFIHQLITLHSKGLDGAAVTNPATIGGVGASIAISVLQGKKVSQSLKLTPEVWSYANLSALKAHYYPKLQPTYSVQFGVKGLTHYTPQQLFSCNGPQ